MTFLARLSGTALGVILVAPGAATATSLLAVRAAEFPTLYVTYATNCTFTITDDAGATVSSIAPGEYQVQVSTPSGLFDNSIPPGSDAPGNLAYCNGMPQFQLTGPGVDLTTTLNGGDETSLTFLETFEPSSTYTAVDLNQPSVAVATFTTTASGSPSIPTVASSGGTGTLETGTSAPTQTGAALKSTPLVKRGSLSGTVSSSGKLTFVYDGKPVTSLLAGKYVLTVEDHSTLAGFTIQGRNGAPMTVTAIGFVGKRTVLLTLYAGQYTYYGTILSAKTYFLVVNASASSS